MELEISAKSSTDALELTAVLAQLGLGQYEERLVDNGFESWEMVTEITEADMVELDFKLGDRRKLQRAVFEHSTTATPKATGLTTNLPLPSKEAPGIGTQTSTRMRRQYRRHPRPDQNAPRKPKTAYVLFSEHVRRDPAISRLSFAEVAKEVGKRWGKLHSKERVDLWEKPASDTMREYKAELERYKKEESYQNYQAYLEDFKRGQHKPESTTPSDDKASSSFGDSRSNQLPASPDQGKPRQAQIGEHDSADPSHFTLFYSDSPSNHLTSPSDSGMEDVRQVLNDLGVNPRYARVNALPPESNIIIAVEAFLHGTGSLLYLWDHEEALGLVKSVYHSKGDLNRLDVTELFAMSAIGSYCDGPSDVLSVQETFLHFFVSMLSSPLDMCNLRRMRLFTCLAVCCFTDSVESARRLMCTQPILLEYKYDWLTARSICS
jgi:hypothetical protein